MQLPRSGDSLRTTKASATWCRALWSFVAALAAGSCLTAAGPLSPAAAATPLILNLGTVGGYSSYATAASGNVIVGDSTIPGIGLTPTHAFAYNLAATNPAMIDLGVLNGGTTSNATAVSGNIVVGNASTTADGDFHAFAYNLGAADPVMTDLGTLGGTSSNATAVSGNFIVGTSLMASGPPTRSPTISQPPRQS